jgi:hypothetical protein
MRRAMLLATSIALAACYNNSNTVTAPPPLPPPANLSYELIPSGDPANPVGVLLRWDPPAVSGTAQFNVYSSSSGSGWILRATTTSASFYDLGVPDQQYAVTAVDVNGGESALSNVVVVNLVSVLPAPTGLGSNSLNGGAELFWDPNARNAAPSQFSYYRVYSTTYDPVHNLCGTQWFLEGTTVSEDFISSGLPNGVPLCFDVSAVTMNGQESQWAVPTAVTPSPDVVSADIVRPKPLSSSVTFLDAAKRRTGTVTTSAGAMTIVWSAK